MNILLESRVFYPSGGGLEMMSQELGKAWRKKGHEVRVVTATPLDGHNELDTLTVYRKPSACSMKRLVKWADVFVQSGISLRSLHWPVLTGTPLVIIHHNLLTPRIAPPVRTGLKKLASHLGVNVAVSTPVAETVPGPTICIPNTFRPVFDQPDAGDTERSGLLFVGRLVSVKGGDVAINALRILRDRGIDTTLTVCGEGPEERALRNRARRLGIEGAVTFEGWATPEELADYYRSVELLVVPSRYEPFGIVALEAIASGCPVVASNTGGLPEAVGSCGGLVEPDAPEALAEGIEAALRSENRQSFRAAMPEHVGRHRIDRIARQYLRTFDAIV